MPRHEEALVLMSVQEKKEEDEEDKAFKERQRKGMFAEPSTCIIPTTWVLTAASRSRRAQGIGRTSQKEGSSRKFPDKAIFVLVLTGSIRAAVALKSLARSELAIYRAPLLSPVFGL